MNLELINTLGNDFGLKDVQLKMPDDGIEGNTFLIDSNKGQFVAKLYRDGERAKKIATLQYHLKNNNLPVAAIIKTLYGDLVGKNSDYFIILAEYVLGEPIGWHADSKYIKSSLSKSLAETLAGMHRIASADFAQTTLEHELSVNHVLASQQRKHEDLERILAKTRRTMIHADLARENIFLTKDRDAIKAIIDFGDAHVDYITYDIAILFTQVYTTKTWGIDFQGIEDFLKAYQRMNTLTTAEKMGIFPLMVLRNDALVRQITQQLANSSSPDESLRSIVLSLQTKLKLLASNRQKLQTLLLQV